MQGGCALNSWISFARDTVRRSGNTKRDRPPRAGLVGHRPGNSRPPRNLFHQHLRRHAERLSFTGAHADFFETDLSPLSYGGSFVASQLMRGVGTVLAMDSGFTAT